MALDFLGRVRGRLLPEGPAKRVECRLDGGGSRQDASVGHADACAVRVTGVGAPSEPDDRVVVLVARAEEARQPRGPADDEREHTACAGVEGAGMADSRFTQHPSHACHDVVRRGTDGFVNDEDAVHHVSCAPAPATTVRAGASRERASIPR